MKAKTIWACVLLIAILTVNTFGQSRTSREAGPKCARLSSEQTGDGIGEITSRIADKAIRDIAEKASDEKRRKMMLWIGLGVAVVVAATVVVVLARRRQKLNSP